MLGGDQLTPNTSVETRHALYKLLQQGVLTDITLSVKDQKLPAHKIILATSSGYFRALFTTQLGKQNDTCLREISGEVMGLLLDYMYLRTLDLTDENVCEVFVVADYLVIDGAIELCSQYLVNRLQPPNCISLFLFSRIYNVRSLKEKSWNYILRNFSKVLEEKKEYLELELEDVIDILRSDFLNLDSEQKVWEAGVVWMDHRKGRKENVVDILRSVRLGMMSPEYFLEKVRDHPAIADSEECRPTIIQALRILFELDITSPDMSEGLNLELVSPRLPHQILFAIGGWSGGSPTNCVEVYDCRSDRWMIVEETDPMGPRAYHGTAVVGQEIFIIGGYNGFDYYNSCRSFNVVDRSWREIAPMNKSRCYVSVAVCDDYIYALGGYNGQRRQNTAERYDCSNNQWTIIADMHCARSDASAACLNGKIFIVGGFNGHECLSSVEVYDPEINEWKLLQSMGVRRSGVSCTVFNDNLYVLGGFNGLSRMASGERYDPRNRRWKPIADMLHARSNFSVACIEDRLLVIGGFNGTSTTADVESYSPITMQWDVIRSLNICRSALACCVVTDIPNIAEYAFPSRNLKTDHEQGQKSLNEHAEAANQSPSSGSNHIRIRNRQEQPDDRLADVE